MSITIKIALIVALAGLAVGVPVAASANHPLRSLSAPARLTMIAPLGGVGPGTSAQTAAAARTCVKYATRAGWPNNGYYAGDLVTAAAICVAESAGDPSRFVCDDANGKIVGSGDYVPGQPVPCPSPQTVSYDRGLWQLNSVNAAGVSDPCAFNPVCNAGKAYLFSQRGTDFMPWSSYDQDVYTPYIDPVQAVVSTLGGGTVTSAELGECLAPAKSSVNAAVVVVNCGDGGTLQQWLTGGGKLRSGSVCATIGSNPPTHPDVVLRRCSTSRSQSWSRYGRYELRDLADGKCLTDPNGNLTAGTKVDVTACANSKDQTWWLP